MNRLALALYVLAAIADVAGLVIALVDLRSRIGRVSAFRIPRRDPPPPIYNEHPSLAALLAAQGPEAAEQRLREGFNEVIGALSADRVTTDEVDSQLAALEGIGTRTGRLWLAFALLLSGTLLGAAGNVMSSAGIGSPDTHCTASIEKAIAPPTTLLIECR